MPSVSTTVETDVDVEFYLICACCQSAMVSEEIPRNENKFRVHPCSCTHPSCDNIGSLLDNSKLPRLELQKKLTELLK